MSAIVPRIFVIISRFYQPLLISRAILFVLSPPTQNDHLDGYWIIAAAAATYIGMAVGCLAILLEFWRLTKVFAALYLGLPASSQSAPDHDPRRIDRIAVQSYT